MGKRKLIDNDIALTMLFLVVNAQGGEVVIDIPENPDDERLLYLEGELDEENKKITFRVVDAEGYEEESDEE